MRLKEATLGIRSCCLILFFSTTSSFSLLGCGFKLYVCVLYEVAKREKDNNCNSTQNSGPIILFRKGVNFFHTVVSVPLCIYECKTPFFWLMFCRWLDKEKSSTTLTMMMTKSTTATTKYGKESNETATGSTKRE